MTKKKANKVKIQVSKDGKKCKIGHTTLELKGEEDLTEEEKKYVQEEDKKKIEKARAAMKQAEEDTKELNLAEIEELVGKSIGGFVKMATDFEHRAYMLQLHHILAVKYFEQELVE